MGEEPVPAGEIDDAAAAAHAPHAPRHLPGFVQLLARQAFGRAHRPRDPDRTAHSPANRPRSCALSRPGEPRENAEAAWAVARCYPATSGTARANLPRRWRALSRNGDSRRITKPIESAASSWYGFGNDGAAWSSELALSLAELLSRDLPLPSPDAVALIVQLARSPQTGRPVAGAAGRRATSGSPRRRLGDALAGAAAAPAGSRRAAERPAERRRERRPGPHCACASVVDRAGTAESPLHHPDADRVRRRAGAVPAARSGAAAVRRLLTSWTSSRSRCPAMRVPRRCRSRLSTRDSAPDSDSARSCVALRARLPLPLPVPRPRRRRPRTCCRPWDLAVPAPSRPAWPGHA